MRLHPFTAVIRGVGGALGGGAVGFTVGGVLGGAMGLVPQWATPLFAVLGGLLGFGYGVAYYLRYEYDLTEDTLDIGSGVISRTERQIPLGRVQTVDVRQDVVQRLFGVAVVRVETAGGGSTEATLTVVSVGEAERLESEIRRRRRSMREQPAESEQAARAVSEETGTDAVASETVGDELGAAVTEPDERTTTLFELGTYDLLVLAMTTIRPGALFAPLLALPLVQAYLTRLTLSTVESVTGTEGLAPGTMTPDSALVVGSLVAALWAGAALLVSGFLSVSAYYDFRLRRRGDDLTYERGLFQRYSGTIPLDKVQTLTVRENVLMRRFGYAGVTVETAGYAGGSNGGGQPSAVPIARYDRALSLARSIVPFGDIEFTRPPKRARRRYAVRYGLVVTILLAASWTGAQVVEGYTLWFLPAFLFLAVPTAAHLKWAHRGYCVGEDFVAVRTGFWRRGTRVVPYYRLQTVTRRRNPFQRRLGLADLVIDTASSATLVGSAPTARDVGADVAMDLHGLLRERLQTSLERGAEARPGR